MLKTILKHSQSGANSNGRIGASGMILRPAYCGTMAILLLCNSAIAGNCTKVPPGLGITKQGEVIIPKGYAKRDIQTDVSAPYPYNLVSLDATQYLSAKINGGQETLCSPIGSDRYNCGGKTIASTTDGWAAIDRNGNYLALTPKSNPRQDWLLICYTNPPSARYQPPVRSEDDVLYTEEILFLGRLESGQVPFSIEPIIHYRKNYFIVQKIEF